ncbi:MAG: DNA/RNA non-specific endonuclease, partial [Pseudomonadales bacterium]|nr:DNA/RNA non-specific endonuclease [Pseudomonadales bacterium]
NRNGAWRFTEEITECNRGTNKDESNVSLKVWGGVIWGEDQSNDYFIESHGVVTPDYLWKVIEFSDGKVNAWIIPNDAQAKRSTASDYLVFPHEITHITGYSFELSQHAIISLVAVDKVKPCSLK